MATERPVKTAARGGDRFKPAAQMRCKFCGETPCVSRRARLCELCWQRVNGPAPK